MSTALRASQDSEADWPAQLRTAYTRSEQLVAAGLMDPAEALALAARFKDYRFAIPQNYAALMDRTDLSRCPIYRQAVPAPGEQDAPLPAWAQALSERVYGVPAPWLGDPIGDLKYLAAPRITHRYQHRALLHVSMACAMYCRFCFRKSHLGSRERSLYGGPLHAAMAYLSDHPEIHEVILTGGDPLSLTDVALQRVLEQLSTLPHVATVRLHSRMAATLPARLSAGLWRALAAVGDHQRVVLVSHFNHPRELTDQSVAGLRAGARHGVVMLNQSTLLARVNDDVEVLYALCARLWRAGIVPYYLHHPDWVVGTLPFRVAIARGRQLMGALAGRLSGPALPNYVLDVPVGRGKVRLMESTVRPLSDPSAHHDDGTFQGGLWELTLPHTREGQGETALYFDFAASRVDDRPIPL